MKFVKYHTYCTKLNKQLKTRKVKTGYTLTTEKRGLLRSNEARVGKDKDGRNIPKLGIADVILNNNY